VTTATRSDDPREAPPRDPDTEKRVVLALIFVSDEPITVEQVRQILRERTPDEIRAIVDSIESELRDADSALRVEEVGGGFRLSTRPDLAPWIRTYFRNRNRSRLSAAAVETLAVIAYKQPITAPEIQEIRGVDPQGALRTLLDRRLVRIAGKKKVVGRPFLYATTREFLVHFGLPAIEDLPPIEDFEQLAGRFAAAEEAGAEGVGAGREEAPGEEGSGEPEEAEAPGAGRRGVAGSPVTKFGRREPENDGVEGEGLWEEDSFTRGAGRSAEGRDRAESGDEE
jgi:segregation and condensation protein B